MSAIAKHTPGPWAVTSVSMDTGNVSVGHRDLRIVIAEVTNAASFGDMLAGAMKRGGGGFEQNDCHTQFANARLIAAAPDMLAALEKARATLHGCEHDGGFDREIGPIGCHLGDKCVCIGVYPILSAAIAKATPAPVEQPA